MKNIKGDIIYIGKAKDLYKRVNSYFQKQKNQTVKTQKLVEKITDIEYVITESELEALILETNLIKEYRPKYNILMKDDKNFAYIKITVNEDYPRILVVRKVLNDKAKYFGPKTAAGKIHNTLQLLRKIYPYRNCNLEIQDLGVAKQNNFNKKRDVKVTKAGIRYPCLDYHIKRCLAPCIGKPDKKEYAHLISKIIDFLEGKYKRITDDLKENMEKAAQNKNFEKAAKIRDQIQTIKELSEKQIINNPNFGNSDIINFYKIDKEVFVCIFQIRDGKIVDQQNVTLKLSYIDEEKDADILEVILLQFYAENSDIPKEILIPEKPNNKRVIEEWLSSISGRAVKISTAQIGKKDKLLEMTLNNAFSYAKQSRTRWEGISIQNRETALKKLKDLISLKNIPKRIECYDISHIGGTYTVASMVVFENGFPQTKQYRHFRIKNEEAGRPDDFKSMHEAILRRIKYIKPTAGKQITTITKKGDKFLVKKEKKLLFEITIIYQNKQKIFLKPITFSLMENEDLIRKILQKLDANRIYFQIKEKEIPYFETLGFQQVKENPQNIKINKKLRLIVFDKIRNKPDPSFKKTPDLILIDGGKGQLSSAVKATDETMVKIPIISLAKKEEEIFVFGKSNSIKLPENDATRLLLQHIRDEAHRFAIEYNRKLRKKDYTVSELENIPGIGKKVTRKLLQHFGSLHTIKDLSEESLADFIGPKLSKKIKLYFTE